MMLLLLLLLHWHHGPQQVCFSFFCFFLVFLRTKPVVHLLVDASTRLLQLTKMGLWMMADSTTQLQKEANFSTPQERSQFSVHLYIKKRPNFQQKKEANFPHSRVDWLVIKHVINCSRQGLIQREGSIVSEVFKQNLKTLLLTHQKLKIVKNELEMRKLQPPK